MTVIGQRNLVDQSAAVRVRPNCSWELTLRLAKRRRRYPSLKALLRLQLKTSLGHSFFFSPPRCDSFASSDQSDPQLSTDRKVVDSGESELGFRMLCICRLAQSTSPAKRCVRAPSRRENVFRFGMSVDQEWSGVARTHISVLFLSLVPPKIMHRKLFKPSHAATSSTSKALPDDKVKEIARAIALKAERDYSNLLAAAQHATHHHKEATDSLKNLLDQILQDTHTAADGHPRKEAVVWTANIRNRLSSTRANVSSSASSPVPRLEHVLVVLQLVRNEYLAHSSVCETAAEKLAVVLKVLVSLHTPSIPNCTYQKTI